MKYGKIFLVAACAATLQTVAFAAPETLEIDPAHSSVGFKVKHLFSYVSGRFDEVTGSIVLDPEKPEEAKVTVTIPAKTINTAVSKRDDHLRSADFFDVEKFPTLAFVSKSVKQTGKDTADVVGDLTMHGVTREVPLKVQFLGKGPGPKGETRVGWQATTKLKRSDFGLKWGKIVEGTDLVGDEVDVTLDIESVKKP